MKVETTTTQVLTITKARSLDPITVVLRDLEPGKGQLLIECYGRAWSAYWGAMGSKSVAEFVRTADEGYVMNCLVRGNRAIVTRDRVQELDEAYVLRIVIAVCVALREQVAVPA